MDNYVYPSDEEIVEIEDEGKDGKKKKLKKIKVKRTADSDTITKLDTAFRRLSWSRDKHVLIKRFLTKPVFEVLKHRITVESNASLLDVIRAAVLFMEADVGIFAADSECYKTFKPFLHPIICSIHDANPDQKQPEENWTVTKEEVGLDPRIDLKGGLVESVAIRLARSIKGYPFQSKMTAEQYAKMENDLKNAFRKITSVNPTEITSGKVKEVPGVSTIVGGSYYPLDKIPKSLERQLDKDGLLFDRNDRVIKAANGYNHWPTGRGIFLVGSSAQVVAHNTTKKKNISFIWVNESDHLKITVGRKDGDLSAAFHTAHEISKAIETAVTPIKDKNQFGYLTFSPGMVGTGLKASVRMHLPFLGSEPIFRNEICSQQNLICEAVPHEKVDNFFEISNKRKFGLTESQIIREVYRGVREILDIERRYK